MERPTPQQLFWCPETLAAHTMLTQLGYAAEDVYYSLVRDYVSRVECIGIIVRPPEARGKNDEWTGRQFALACDAINYANVVDADAALARLSDDIALWNTTSQEFRQKHLDASRIRSRAADLVFALDMRGLPPTESRGQLAPRGVM